jgi:hypothetical protein
MASPNKSVEAQEPRDEDLSDEELFVPGAEPEHEHSFLPSAEVRLGWGKAAGRPKRGRH